MADLDKMARELLADCLYDWGCPQEARNVRTGEDIESYEVELRLIIKLHSYGLLRFAGEPLHAPPGYALVPVEPTRQMLGAFLNATQGGYRNYESGYLAMLAAAPEVK